MAGSYGLNDDELMVRVMRPPAFPKTAFEKRAPRVLMGVVSIFC